MGFLSLNSRNSHVLWSSHRCPWKAQDVFCGVLFTTKPPTVRDRGEGVLPEDICRHRREREGLSYACLAPAPLNINHLDNSPLSPREREEGLEHYANGALPLGGREPHALGVRIFHLILYMMYLFSNICILYSYYCIYAKHFSINKPSGTQWKPFEDHYSILYCTSMWPSSL